MSRSALTIWNQRVQRRLARATGESPLSPEALEAAIAAVARELRVDPVLLLGSLAAKPTPASLWNEVLRTLGTQNAPRHDDWSAVTAAAEAVAGAVGKRILTGWVVEPSQPGEVFVLAACLAVHCGAGRLDIVATHSDARMVELGHSGLVDEGTLLRAPAEVRIYFRHLGRCWQTVQELRESVRFESVPPCDLPGMRAPSTPDDFDLVVARGQFARLERGVGQRVARRLQRALREDGFLFVAPGDHDDRLFGDLEPYVAPGVLLYRKGPALHTGFESVAGDFAALLTAVETDPVAWEPRWQLACLLLREGYGEAAIAHLRELARWRPEFPGVWLMLSKAHTLAGDTAAAALASSRAALVAESAGAPKLLM